MGDAPVPQESTVSRFFKNIGKYKVFGDVRKHKRAYAAVGLLLLGAGGVVTVAHKMDDIAEYFEDRFPRRTASLPDENAGPSVFPVDSKVHPNKIAYQSGSPIGLYPADIQTRLDAAGNVSPQPATQTKSQTPQTPQPSKGKNDGERKPRGTAQPKPKPVEYFEPWSGTGWSEPNYPSSDENRRTSYGPSYTSGSNGLIPPKEKLNF